MFAIFENRAIPTGVDTTAELHGTGGPVSDSQHGTDCLDHVQRHFGDLSYVDVAVSNRQPGRYHVRIAYCFNLEMH